MPVVQQNQLRPDALGTDAYVGMALNRESQHRKRPPSLNTLARLWPKSVVANVSWKGIDIPCVVETLLCVLLRPSPAPVLEDATPNKDAGQVVRFALASDTDMKLATSPYNRHREVSANGRLRANERLANIVPAAAIPNPSPSPQTTPTRIKTI